ncbi:DUF429 domain-containing protein [Pseudokineococcus sp. 5B2Z-1]|uniref:DUF429 domain-containing protein n=1 Tax=Pseudokineococcus sp. 5B2Z-1 TaxID=3132744 RepID=UPI0030953EE4
MAGAMGVDGAAGRWACALWAGPGAAPVLLLAEHPADVRRRALEHGVAAVGLDLPLGLVDEGARGADLAARRALLALADGPDARSAGSRVFLTPARPVVDHGGSYAEARALARSLGAPSPSAQAFALLAHVRAWDAEARRWPELGAPPLLEVHPEVSLARMAGRVLAPKRSARGAAQRLELLAGDRGLGCGRAALDGALAAAPVGVALDDALDAAAAAWSARRAAEGRAEPLAVGEQRDGDRLVAIWV